ncbi:unnamed protein product [Parnassius apollo]|uniref:(apollo) hypothetical protein n=1 Tax=Parnassius apollo TaxID=110799 RepID=A0A8S3W0Q3_PARAO|nr:unnamed protein product [Parnassius apollo]
MATMIKEKRSEKKKTKDKSTHKNLIKHKLEEDVKLAEKHESTLEDIECSAQKDTTVNSEYDTEKNLSGEEDSRSTSLDKYIQEQNQSRHKQSELEIKEDPDKTSYTKVIDGQYEKVVTNVNEVNIENDISQIEIAKESINSANSCEIEHQDALPSAPIFEEETVTFVTLQNVEPEIVIPELKTKVECMPLEEAVRIFGGKEITEVRTISEKEEAIVEAGPVSGPEHPLVDLLSTFRSSLNAVDRSRTTISKGFIEEEKSRLLLWKVEKRKVYLSEKCPCGNTVSLQATFDHAELLKEKLPAARMRLEALSREVQDSYCHHQHTALLAYWQIEELVYETMRSNKGEIREALSLILQALRLSDSTSEAYSSALQRWAVALSASLLHGQDLRQLIFLIQHLFRQTRSVHWAAQVIRVQVTDLCSAARIIALLELILARPGLETAVECTEDLEEVWEEVGRHGEGSAVREGRLRERDALALLRTLPLRQLLAKLVLFTRSDIRSTQEQEWGDTSGGHGVVKAACGVRALVDVLRRAACAHAQYARLQRALRALAAAALRALAALHLHSRVYYYRDLQENVLAELEACFTAGLTLLDAADLHKLPATLLSSDAARDYCLGLMLGIHEKRPHHISSLRAELPALDCDTCVGILVQAALDRTDDHELARMLLDFLCQTAMKPKPAACKNSCELKAREGLPRLLAVHPYLHTTSFHMLADLNQAEPVDPASVSYLSVEEWRPTAREMLAVLEDWSQRCPQFIEHLLLQLDYTPYEGLSLETQLSVGAWLCGHVRTRYAGVAPEWAWCVLRRLRTHRTYWRLPLDAPPPDNEPDDLFSTTFALLSTSWGHSVPLICSEGARALKLVARARAWEAARCARLAMRVLRHSPESIALTPEFTEVFNVLLAAGPSLVSRALGRGGPSGAELLQQELLNELNSSQYESGAISPWLRGLWAPFLGSSARAILDVALRAARDWPALDSTVAVMLQDENRNEYISDAVRCVHVAPLLCEAVLRGAHAHCEARTPLWTRLLHALAHQRQLAQRTHVDNALKQIGVTMSAEDLVIYRVATAVLSAPWQNPAHLTLWRLFFHLYLQRPQSSPQDSTPPIGPLFFSGIIKSRTLSQVKKRLQETITYHHSQAERLKSQINANVQTHKNPTSSKISTTKTTIDSNMFPAISIIDLAGESSSSETETDEETSDEEKEGVRVKKEEEINKKTTGNSRETLHLLNYHVAAEKLVREYARWLEEGDKVRAVPHHADIARFISEQGLDAAWKSSLPSCSNESLPTQPRAPRKPPPLPLQMAIDNLLEVNDRSSTRPRVPNIKPVLDGDNNLADARVIYSLVDRYLKDIEALAKEWASDVERLCKLDSKVWELVAALRVRRPLPPCLKKCENNCKPLTFVIQKDEWVISTGAEQGIQENRRSALAVLRRVARPRPHAARLAAALHTLARNVRSGEVAERVAERAAGGVTASARCPLAHSLLHSLVSYLAERWLCGEASRCVRLVARWGGRGGAALCGVLVAPRRLPPAHHPQLYRALLHAQLPPHAAFSCLSRFEIGSWTEKVNSTQREEMLDILIEAAQRWGPNPDPEYHILLELVGVHLEAVCGQQEICGLLVRCSRACACGSLPSAVCTHLNNAARKHAHALNSNQLGNLLRELGVIWWETRTAAKAESHTYEPYAPHVAELLGILQRAFVAATRTLGHDVEKLSWFAWCALREAWAAWVQAGDATPLLSVMDSDAHAHLLERFLHTLRFTIEDCPGSEEYILRYVWEWAVHTYLGVSTSRASQESRVQVSALLGTLSALDWPRQQWVHAGCLPLALQVSRSEDKELTSWCCSTWRGTAATAWLRGLADQQLAPQLAALLALLCSPHLQHSQQTLEEATHLPWWRLPETALDTAMEQFFIDHHNPALPYHEVPQFRVILAASQLAGGREARGARARRLRGVAQCVRASSAPALAAHVRAHTAFLLRTLAELAPQIENSEGEMEELLSRAIVIMCIEPAAEKALPVWEQWIQQSTPRLRLACASAVASLTALDYFCALADCVARAHIAQPETEGWGALRARWRACAWDSDVASGAAAARRRAHAAYALLAHAHAPVLRALADTLLTSGDDEPITAVWVCVACRLARESEGESGEAGRSLLSSGAVEPRRSLLHVVSLQQRAAPNARIRLLCRFAQCILNPESESLVRAYEATCAAVLGSNDADVMAWGKAPSAKLLPRLALRLFPGKEAYFKEELDMVPEDASCCSK